MPDYKSMYFKLFNKITDTIESLKEAQQEAEEQYLAAEENAEKEEETPNS